MSRTGLWDPWETHYGEVARNIITRGDPMDLRYKPGYGPDGRRENQFRSKHVLPFWGMAAGLWVFDSGKGPAPDEMVASSRPLWALRLPSMLMALWGVGALALALHRCVSPRVAFVTAWVLATTPQFFMMARQATTDIYALGPMCLALGAFIGARYGPDRALERRKVAGFSLPWDRSALAFVGLYTLMVLVPIALLWGHVSNPRIIEMVGNWPKKDSLPDVQDLASIAQVMLSYGALALAGLFWCLRAKSRSELCMYTVYLAGGWALMGKGMLVPGLLALLFVLDEFRRGQLLRFLSLKPLAGLLLFVLASAPWHHAMAIFRKDPWIHELLIENNLERFLSGEQVQAVGDLGYYLAVLLSAAGVWIFVWPHQRRQAHPVYGFAKLGLGLSLGVISLSATKYAHYAAVTLPFAAMLWGRWATQEPGRADPGQLRVRWIQVGALALLGLWILLHLQAEPARLVHLTTYLSTGIWRTGAGELWPYLTLLGLGCLWRCAYVLAPRGLSRVFLPGFLAISMAAAWVLLLQYLPQSSRAWSQAEVIRSYYARRGPKDEIASWWFYHRGETFYTKRKIWVQATPDPALLRSKVQEMRAKGGDFWIVTNPLHLPRLREHLPASTREDLEIVERRPHQLLLRLPLQGPDKPG